ncbi:MAG TPA: hypothetical protein DEP42_04800 [Ruminococcaceae bacterium]|nr:hypothetical protein [Oscillospiraceae bacterium]
MANNDLSDAFSSLLSNPENLQKIQGLMGMLSSGNGQNEGKEESATSSTDPQSGSSNATAAKASDAGGENSLPFDPSMLFKLQKAMSLVRQDDPRVAFLRALKPNLSANRRKRVDEAVRLLQLIHLVPFFREQHFL